MRRPRVSVLIPARDEAGNVEELVARVARAFQALGLREGASELVLVDDGSADGTGAIAERLAATYPFLRVLRHRHNMGLTAALRTGFAAVQGDLILFLPADLESDPETDIPLLLGKLEEGYDVVAGWRQGRSDGKVLASNIYNRVSRWLFGVNAHDMNWIKGFRREVIESMPPLRSDWHRFLLHMAANQGFRIGEVATPWHPRRSGRSKYGLSRIPISLLDVLVVKFLLTFSRSPMRFFGGLGLLCLTASAGLFAFLLYLWLSFGKQLRPVFITAVGLWIGGLLLFLIGFLAELVVSQSERLIELEQDVRALRSGLGRHLGPAGWADRADDPVAGVSTSPEQGGEARPDV